MNDKAIFGANAPDWRKEQAVLVCERLWSDRHQEGAPRIFGQEPDLSWSKEALLGAITMAGRLYGSRL